MNASLLLFLICLGAGLFCLGGFLWSAMDGKPKSTWLIGAAAAVLVGIAGLLIYQK